MNIIKDGARLALGLFVTLLAWLVISNPITTIFTAFDTMDAGQATNQLNTLIPLYTQILYMFFTLLGGQVISWFFFRVFQREPDWRY